MTIPRLGSSPHARGLHVQALAHVAAPVDHPRTRGVYGVRVVVPCLVGGSSPHTRGLRPVASRREARGRIIPAHAGFTRTGPGRSRSRADHPRTRGVYYDACVQFLAVGGSSPHTRGLLQVHLHLAVLDRIIPAHAGFTARAADGHPADGDHPRTRGVYLSSSAVMRVPSGSSPHTRGLLPRVRRGGHGCRIIPAHAGFTGHAHHPPIMYEDHPRTRGVYHLWPRGGFVSGGSSPHTRGLPPLAPRGLCQRRIIPAHAGFTSPGRSTASHATDHPRTRGVYRARAPPTNHV